jgi:hypothetical protein
LTFLPTLPTSRPYPRHTRPITTTIATSHSITNQNQAPGHGRRYHRLGRNVPQEVFHQARGATHLRGFAGVGDRGDRCGTHHLTAPFTYLPSIHIRPFLPPHPADLLLLPPPHPTPITTTLPPATPGLRSSSPLHHTSDPQPYVHHIRTLIISTSQHV